MKKSLQALLGLSVLLAAQLACNMPNAGSGGTPIPGPEQTITALYAFTPAVRTPTATLPPVVTATSPAGSNPTATTGGTNPTATTGVSQPTTANQPTATRAAAQATATIPGVRPRAQIVAKYLNTPPTIDGDWTEWKDITTEYPAATVVYGPEDYTGQDDLAGSFHIGWDNNYLYVAVKVRDDTYVQNATGEDIFMGDSIEILLDTKLQEDFYYESLSADDFQLGISPGRPEINGVREAYLWLPSSISGVRTNITIGAIESDGVYRVEAAIPWNVFETVPTAGTHMGFALSVSDNDNTGKNEQQTMVSNVGTRRLTNPTTWGDIHFTK